MCWYSPLAGLGAMILARGTQVKACALYGDVRSVGSYFGFGGLGKLTVLPFMLDALEDLFAMHRHRAWRVDSHANLIAFDTQDRDGDLVADHDRLTDSPRQNQHRPSSLCRHAISANANLRAKE